MLQCPKCGRQFGSDVAACPEDGTPLQADPTLRADIPLDPLEGRVLDDKYRLDSRLGEGGMGTVYRATHLLIERPVAVKVLNPRLVTDDAARERFRREARAAGRIQHSNAVAVTDFGETRDGLVYLVMELLEGKALRDILAREAPLDPARAVSLMLQCAAAVAAAHEAGVIHRDLKPGNIFVVQRPNAPYLVKVLDFGIAKLAVGELGEGSFHDTLTGTGVMIGTPRYMSPEQCDGANLTPASDVYSLGVILYEMLTGQTPFTGATPLSLALKHSSETPKPPREIVPTIPPALEAVVLKALGKDAGERHKDAGEFRRELYAVAERLGLEHSAGFSAPTIETLRDAGTETPSGRLVIDIERMRRSRAASGQTTESEAKETDEIELKDTAGRPVAPQAAGPRPVVKVESRGVSTLAARLSGGARALKGWLTQPLAFVVVLCLALLLVFGGLLLWRSRTPEPTRAAGADEAGDAVGRELSSSADSAPRGRQVSQPRTATDFFETGTYFASIRSYDAAAGAFRRAVELQPEFPTAYNRLGIALLNDGKHAAAAEAFRTAIKQRGDYATAHYNLGFTLQRQNDTEGALAAYRDAVRSRGGTYPDALYQIGNILVQTPRREAEAVEPLRKAIEQNKGRDPEAHLLLGVALAKQKDYAGAEAEFREALNQRGGDFAAAHYNLGLLYETTGRLPEAVEEYEKYLEKSPGAENRSEVQGTIRDLRRRVERQGDGQQ